MKERDKFFEWYNKYLKSDKWKEKKKGFLKFLEVRDYEIACVRCGNPNKLEFHHIHYDTVGDETINDVLLLCHDCHKYWHKLEKKFTPDQKFNREDMLFGFINGGKWFKKVVKYKKVGI